MQGLHAVQTWMARMDVPAMGAVGLLVLVAYYFGRSTRWVKLPSLIGYMVIGLLCGPSGLNLLTPELQEHLSFITDLTLGLVAVSIGLELSIRSLRSLGTGIISIILCESLVAFAAVAVGVYLLTGNLVLSLVFGSLAPASAPAGTVAVIREYKARGSLTKALYAVVGFDDGLAIIIFGFAATFARMLLDAETSGRAINAVQGFVGPLLEIALSVLVGLVVSAFFLIILRKHRSPSETLILLLGFVALTNGICAMFHLSLILTNMIIGFVLVNSQQRVLLSGIEEQLTHIMPFFFVLFFALAGAHLEVGMLPALGWLGVVYIACRMTGLIAGARIGGELAGCEPKVKQYVGLGILSQAGVAIGLALIVKTEFSGLGRVTEIVAGEPVTSGDMVGITAITVITATSIFFEVLGPILTKFALTRANEIPG